MIALFPGAGAPDRAGSVSPARRAISYYSEKNSIYSKYFHFVHTEFIKV